MKILFVCFCLGWMSVFTKHTFVEGQCPPQWLHFGDYCYVAYRTLQDFNSGEAGCISLESSLASIHSQQEMSAITSLISSGPQMGYYIGLYVSNIDRSWKYTDSTSYYYNNWLAGEPSQRQDESCVIIRYDGKWEDVNCLTPYGGICKRGIYSDCSAPITFDFHLSINPSQIFYENEAIITYSCDEGYYLDGEPSATCSDGEFDPPEVPQCEETLQCYNWRDVVCDPGSTGCDTSENKERTVEACDKTVEKCYVHHYTITADSGSLDATSGGCVTVDNLVLSYGCYDRSYLQTVDPSGYNELTRLESEIGAQSDDVQICVCDREICNESLETASRNNAITFGTKLSWILTSMITILAWQT